MKVNIRGYVRTEELEYLKNIIFNEIKQLTEKINTIHAQKNACNRIINRYEEIKEDYKKR